MKTFKSIKYEYNGKTFPLSIKQTKKGNFLYVGNKPAITFADTLNLIVNDNKYQIKYCSRYGKFQVSLTTEYLLAGNDNNLHACIDYSTSEQYDMESISFALDCFLKWSGKNPVYLVTASKKLAS